MFIASNTLTELNKVQIKQKIASFVLYDLQHTNLTNYPFLYRKYFVALNQTPNHTPHTHISELLTALQINHQ